MDGAALSAWRGYLLSHAVILRTLDADLVTQHGITARDYEALMFLAQAPDGHLAMSELADRMMLTRSGVTRMIGGLEADELVERIACPNDARVSYVQLSSSGEKKLTAASKTHVDRIEEVFLAHFSDTEVEELAELLGRLPGAECNAPCSN